MSYGLEEYGIDPYGSQESTLALSIVSAMAVSTNVVRVTFAKEPQHIAEQVAGDVQNPRTWSVIDTVTGVGYTIVCIAATPNKKEWDIRVLEVFASVNILHHVAAPTLIDATGRLISQSPGDFGADFSGILDASQSTHERKAAAQNFAIRDLSNPQASLPSGSSGGVYTIAKDGDYLLHDGTDFVKKLIFRRLMTTKGAFRWLPDYGVGVRVKEPLPTGDLISLQKAIADQVKLEPEVDRVKVSVSQDQNALTIVVLARLKLTGQQISVPFSTPFGVNL